MRTSDRLPLQAAAVGEVRGVNEQPNSILSDDDVVRIRERAIDDGVKSHELAAVYGVDAAYVRRIVRGEVRKRAGGPTRHLRQLADADRNTLITRVPRRDDEDELGLAWLVEVTHGLELRVPYELPEHSLRLMDVLGVRVVDATHQPQLEGARR
jgi:hypothetical protein